MFSSTKSRLLLSLLLLPLSLFAFGIGDWQETTPGGNSMDDPGDGTHLYLTKSNKRLYRIEKWYFYKGYIVAELDSSFLVVNESTETVNRLSSKEKWQAHLEQNHLQPFLWTRWYTDNWMDLGSEMVLIWLIFGFFITIPLCLGFLFLCYRAIWVERFRLDQPSTFIVILVSLVVGITVLLDYFPSSF